jgi:hypothetical protein
VAVASPEQVTPESIDAPEAGVQSHETHTGEQAQQDAISVITSSTIALEVRLLPTGLLYEGDGDNNIA